MWYNRPGPLVYPFNIWTNCLFLQNRDEVPFAGKSYKNLFLDLTILGSVDDTSVQAEYASRYAIVISAEFSKLHI